MGWTGLGVALAIAAALTWQTAGQMVGLAATASTPCQATTVTARSQADAWIAESGAASGTDAILNVEANPSSGNSRALVRFGLPAAAPAGCVVESASLRLFTSSGSEGARVEAVRLRSAWGENQVTWTNQPGTTGPAATAWSTDGYVRWNVAAQVQAILDQGVNHGFLIRDTAEGTVEGGAGHGFHAREKGEDPPELVIRFGAPPSGEPPAPPAPPAPTAVRCGQVLTQSTRLTNALANCGGDGLVIGAHRIVVDLGGHTIDGTGLGTGIRNEGWDSVTVRNGTVRDFDHGVQLRYEAKLGVVERLTLRENQLAGVELFDARAGNEIRSNVLEGNGDAIALVSGTTGTTVVDNTMTGNSGAGLLVRDSDANHLALNRVSGGGDLGVGLERASGNVVLGNAISGNSDGGIELHSGSDGNRVEGNELSESGDTGILVDESHRNELISNTSRLMSDSGIGLNDANDGVVRDNDVRFNPGGLQIDGSTGNLIESNDASESSGYGIELGGGAFDNVVRLNTADGNAAAGIYVADEALDAPGNLLDRNRASGNSGDGIAVAKGGHTITQNVARDNGGWGITATGDNEDGGGNVATGNRVGQCSGVVCNRAVSPDTAIDDGPDDPTRDDVASFEFSGVDESAPADELRFECRLDSSAEADFASCSSPQVYADLGPGPHRFDVRAIDGADADPTPAAHTWTIDLAPPQTTIDAAPDSATPSTNATFAFSASEPGSTFECSLDDEELGECESPIEYAGLEVGDHEFRVQATDPAGNVDATPAVHVWTVEPPDTTAPETTIVSGPSGETTSTSATFAFSSNEPGARFECALDAAAFAPCTSPRQYNGLAAGTHTFSVRAIDRAGNRDQSAATRGWTITKPLNCGPEQTLPALADAWADQNSASSNNGRDSILKVQSKGPRDNMRALVRFRAPTGVPGGCAVQSASLRLFAASARTGRTLQALRLGGAWSETAVTWANQPLTTGAAAATASGTGLRTWDVTLQVRAIHAAGAEYGFLIRDAAENADAEQQFHSREKGQNPPQLVVRFAPG